ncbi:MAG: DNA repair protein RecO [Eubacteriales bacterium]
MYLKTNGLVVRDVAYQDDYRLLTVLTPDHGKMTFKSKVAKGKQSAKASACQLLSYSEFTVFIRKGFCTIREAVGLEHFLPLRNDLELLSLATYFAQVAEVVSQEDCPNPELLSLTLNAMYAISKLSKPQMLVKSVFELRIACLAGYLPMVENCALCGCTPECFDVSAGMALCKSCRKGGGLRIPMAQDTWQAVTYVTTCQPGKLFSFTLPDHNLRQLADIGEAYLMTQLERGFTTLDFYKSILI